jgi:hypothetical protein
LKEKEDLLGVKVKWDMKEMHSSMTTKMEIDYHTKGMMMATAMKETDID